MGWSIKTDSWTLLTTGQVDVWAGTQDSGPCIPDILPSCGGAFSIFVFDSAGDLQKATLAEF